MGTPHILNWGPFLDMSASGELGFGVNAQLKRMTAKGDIKHQEYLIYSSLSFSFLAFLGNTGDFIIRQRAVAASYCTASKTFLQRILHLVCILDFPV
jgi:hypothetical protein